MHHFDPFEFYRFMLAVLVSTYTLLRLVMFIWQWQGPAGAAKLGSPLAYRYIVVLLLGVRLRRFIYEFVVIGGLLAIFVVLVLAHGG